MKTKTKYLYNAFGLNLESDFILNGLTPSNGLSDVRIYEGYVPVEFSEDSNENTHWSEGKDNFAFRLVGVGIFLIRNGNEIIIQS